VGLVLGGWLGWGLAVLIASVIYIGLMLKVVSPLVAKVMKPASFEREFSSAQLGFLFCVLLTSSLVAEVIGIHALFGAFLAGVIMPQNVSFRSGLMEKIEDLTSVVLLPIFFVYTGLRTQIGLLNTAEAWGVCAAITALAIVGKMFGSAFAARCSGQPWRDSWAIGALMNTRGLMELIVLNIGYDLGILAPDLFAMMIIMAIVTTTMTTPIVLALRPTSGRPQ
jgi:Kef-type K+ transport system membrane component KefB